MGKPAIDIQVDDVTGRWSVDALPMILVPQHFFLNNHYAVEAALGPEKLEEILRPAGHRSAYFWCEKEAAHHGMGGVEVFHHYMKRITQRGWGQFDVLDLDPEAGTAHVRLNNSAMVDEARRKSGRKVCYMFAAWLEGSLEYVAASAGRKQRLKAREVYCAAEGQHDHCLFEVLPQP
ncbi:MAG: 4-vinyl reductase [Rhizobiales bacterium]|nr:4-vinyl reductase [Hyphomicrobiales bacterium]